MKAVLMGISKNLKILPCKLSQNKYFSTNSQNFLEVCLYINQTVNSLKIFTSPLLKQYLYAVQCTDLKCTIQWFEKCLHLCIHHFNKDTEYFYHLHLHTHRQPPFWFLSPLILAVSELHRNIAYVLSEV